MNAGASAEQVSVVTAVASSSVSSEKSLETAGLLQELDWIDSDAMIANRVREFSRDAFRGSLRLIMSIVIALTFWQGQHGCSARFSLPCRAGQEQLC